MNQDNNPMVPRKGQTAARKKKIVFWRKATVVLCALLILAILVLGVFAVCRKAFNGNRPPKETDRETERETDAPGTQPGVVTEPATEAETEPETEPIPETDPPSAKNGILVVLDPGHGFDDPGTFSEFTEPITEKDITLDICLAVRDILKYRGYTVILTHDTNERPAGRDYYLFNPNNRADFCYGVLNQYGKIDVFVSVHCNSSASADVNGTQIYYHKGNSAAVALLNEKVGEAITAKTGNSVSPIYMTSGVYRVINTTAYPAILIETDFVTNEEAAEKMKTEEWRQAMAEAIAQGIAAAYPA
ncbi:MAG: N-acetylmuramoyl-L-alanine amidase [Lachnospiraceae bacterium]|nr:N-acetylmuramoyl-L-alanine amidase [Lachnospiraceae bacterium]